MASIGFTSPVAVGGVTKFHGSCIKSSTSSRSRPSVMRMSLADEYIAVAVVKDGKRLSQPYGVYTPQCTEGTATSNSAYSKRVATLSKEFRLRQASLSQKYADLFATRREAMCLAKGMHFAETSAVQFPSAASSKIRAYREADLACDRYFVDSTIADNYMHNCVKKQYVKALICPTGIFGTGCADGATLEQAQISRTAALAVEYAAGMMTPSQKTRMRYNASSYANLISRGCSYEEEEFIKFPKMASGIQGLTTGAYAASVGGAEQAGSRSVAQLGKKKPGLMVRLNAVNADALFPSSKIRAAVKKERPFWSKVSGTVKSYAYMSEAAVEYGKKASEKPFDDSQSYADSWSPGWVPTSTTQKIYQTI